LKRAGLDYHEFARVRVHRDFAACRDALESEGRRRWFAFATDGPSSLYATRFQPNDVLVFGRESTGLSPELRACFAPDAILRIPMRPGVRSLNLSNAVAVAVYEAWRQAGFAGALPEAGANARPET
jgi:tRNA (cytidine/uridine-2'-O-)-methyltransferase